MTRAGKQLTRDYFKAKDKFYLNPNGYKDEDRRIVDRKTKFGKREPKGFVYKEDIQFNHREPYCDTKQA